MRYEANGTVFTGTYEEVCAKVKRWHEQDELEVRADCLCLKCETIFIGTASHLRTMSNIKGFLIDLAIKKIPKEKEIKLTGRIGVWVNGEKVGNYSNISLDTLNGMI